MRRQKTDVRRENMDARWVGFHPPEAIVISHLLELSFGSAKDEEKENTGT